MMPCSGLEKCRDSTKALLQSELQPAWPMGVLSWLYSRYPFVKLKESYAFGFDITLRFLHAFVNAG